MVNWTIPKGWVIELDRRVKDAVPDRYAEVVKSRFRATFRSVARTYWRGSARYCPLCQSHLRAFRPAGIAPRPSARCPVCGSLERHRLLWLYLTERSNLFAPPRKRLLHVSPEYVVSTRLRHHPAIDYVSSDLESKHAMVQMDITAIQMPDATFDAIICNHVLEHIPDDRQAMSELFRVLKPGGWAILQSPIIGETTHEDRQVRSPAERRRVFGQRDHVRAYGRDYVGRLADVGFDVLVDDFVRTRDASIVERLGLDLKEDVYFCRKPV